MDYFQVVFFFMCVSLSHLSFFSIRYALECNFHRSQHLHILIFIFVQYFQILKNTSRFYYTRCSWFCNEFNDKYVACWMAHNIENIALKMCYGVVKYVWSAVKLKKIYVRCTRREENQDHRGGRGGKTLVLQHT